MEEMQTRTKRSWTVTNPNFNVKLVLNNDGLLATQALEFLNACLCKVSARMMWKGRRPGAKTMNKDTSQEGFRLFFSSLGKGDTDSTRSLLSTLLTLEKLVDTRRALNWPLRLEVNFLGETQEFVVSDFVIMAIDAEQEASSIQFEVRLILV
jgi:hypothetical protein